MKTDENGFEIQCYRLVWCLDFGWIGDSEGRTWDKNLKSREKFPTREAAQHALENHPETEQTPWGSWRPTYPYGLVAVHMIKELIE